MYRKFAECIVNVFCFFVITIIYLFSFFVLFSICFKVCKVHFLLRLITYNVSNFYEDCNMCFEHRHSFTNFLQMTKLRFFIKTLRDACSFLSFDIHDFQSFIIFVLDSNDINEHCTRFELSTINNL